jgi:hypothetical protein
MGRSVKRSDGGWFSFDGVIDTLGILTEGDVQHLSRALNHEADTGL